MWWRPLWSSSSYLWGLLFGLNRLGVWTDETIRAAFDFVERNAAVLGPVAAAVVAVLYVASFFLTLHFFKKMEF